MSRVGAHIGRVRKHNVEPPAEPFGARVAHIAAFGNEYFIKSVQPCISFRKLGVFGLYLKRTYFGEFAVRRAEQGNDPRAAAEFAGARIAFSHICRKQI